jgi:hypothetical protein
MRLDSGLCLERTDNELIVRSEPTTVTTKLCGVLLAGFALIALLATWPAAESVTQELVRWIGDLFMAAFFVAGVSIALPRSVITIFDLRSRSVLRKENAFPWLNRNRRYSFAQIRGVGVRKTKSGNYDDAPDHMPVIALEGGKMLPLGTLSIRRSEVDDTDHAKSIDAICAATGLPRCDKDDAASTGSGAARAC